MGIILEAASVLIAWILTIAILTLIFDGKDAFKRRRY
jgi:hypothetical protein